ncbi:hypothetical protein NDR87_30580 [Nocardia sp. CDC159]|uniref:Uncharacterized protein n=1 Tax=Nocardia pulmonis TaxID=2951408 RepID=A0A9X2EBU3_9NOCA|nr:MULTISPECIES: hypothetical protein [Nocardia]MCM6777842.1 hypothetical protein [Nocardia pulmonis]MCM6790726.1 hypothetical protein [Nocardia sp. CDC159]
MSPRTTRPGLATAIRVVAAVTVVGSAVAVTALTVRQHDQVTSVVVTEEVPIAPAAPRPATPAPAAPAAPAAPPAHAAPAGPRPAAAVPLGTGGPALSVAIHPGSPGPAPDRSTPLNTQSPGTPDAVPLADSPFTAPTANTQPACPLGWPAPQQQGGLASLIGLAPLAGPFSSEAFALGSVYQPVLRLAGPVLAEIAPVIARYQPTIDPIITQVQGVEAVVLQAILPYYGPYRGQLIAAEGELARQLAPILDRVYNSEAAACFVAWQGQLIERAKGGPVRVPSLAHPGAIVELRPES